VNPELCRVAVTAAEAIGIPVTGIDLLVPDVAGEEYAFIEANERPDWQTTNHNRPQRLSSTTYFPVSPVSRWPGLRRIAARA